MRGLLMGSGHVWRKCSVAGQPRADRLGWMLLLPAICIVVLVAGVGNARAAISHEFIKQITETPTEGPGSEPVAFPGPLVRPEELAVDAGRLYVAEPAVGEERLNVFATATDEFVLQFPRQPTLQRLGRYGLAVGDSTGATQVYAGAEDTSGGEETVPVVLAVFDGSGKPLGRWTGADTPLGTFGPDGVVGVAVDNSSSLSWASGDVYVANHAEGKVDVYKPSAGGGEPPALEAELEAEPGVPFTFKSLEQAIAVDQQTGDLLVADHEGTVVDIFAPAALPGQFELAGQLGPFANVRSLAADSSSGDIYVIGGGARVQQFDAAGNFLGALSGTPQGGFGEPLSVAVDGASGDVFVGESTEAVIDVFGPSIVLPDATTEPASNVSTGSAQLNGVANPAGVQVTGCHFDYGTTTAYGQTQPCAQTPGEIGAGGGDEAVSAAISGLTPGVTYHFRLSLTNANGTSVGVDRLVGPANIESESSSAIEQTTATLEAAVNPDGVDTTYHFEYGTSTAYGSNTPVPDVDIGAGEESQALIGELTGLQAGVTYHYRLVATNAAGTTNGPDRTFTTITPALIDSVTISGVSATSATVHAKINPLGADTTYHFEYGTTTAYGASIPIPDADIGAGTSDVSVSQVLSGLSANTTYHVRVAAQNALGVILSSDHTFTYNQTGSGGLPDNRAYEMVTPPEKNGALIGDVTFGTPPSLSEDGSRLILGAVQCFANAGSCVGVRVSTGTPYSFTRGSGGWVPSALAPPATEFAANTWSLVNADTDTALFSMPTPPGGEDHFYARNPSGEFADIGPVSPVPNARLLKEVLGTGKTATADLSHLVVAPAVRPIWSFDPGQSSTVYEYSGRGNAEPSLVGVSGGQSSTAVISECATELGGAIAELPFGDLSADGRTVFFTADHEATSGVPCLAGSVAPPVDELFARIDNGEAGARTVAISQPSAISPVPPNHRCETSACIENTSNPARFRNAQFVGASADGSQVFFTDTQQLTDDASEDPSTADTARSGGCAAIVGANGCNLYVYDSPREDPVGGLNLLDASAGDASNGPQVQGVLAYSSDGSHVYFVAKGVLTGAPNQQGQTAHEGLDNLYVFEHDEAHPNGRVAFIASMSEADGPEWQQSVGRPANVTPDGRYLVFTSGGRLTADDTRTDGAQQVFMYDAQAETLVRVSRGEDGFNDDGNAGLGDASIVPGIKGFTQLGAGRTDPTMSHDGQYVFFMSSVGLTPGALDSLRVGTANSGGPAYAQNVYEYHDGDIRLISDGRDASGVPSELCGNFSAVCLIGTDATGSNVFFATADQLVPQDTDTQVDFYDARICTTSEPCIPAPAAVTPPCLGEACHGTPSSPSATLSPGSASFSGSGNVSPPIQPAGKSKSKPKTAAQLKAEKLKKALKACRTKRNKAKRVRCEAQARKRYGTKSKAKAKNDKHQPHKGGK
jgi:hypothetical protein